MAEIESEIETSGAGKAACKMVNQGPAVTRLPKPAHDWRRFFQNSRMHEPGVSSR